MLVCVKVLLLLFSLFLVSAVFGQGTNTCSSGFMKLDILKKRAEKIPNGGSSQNRLNDDKFRLYNFGFNRGGQITSLLLGIDITGGIQYPEVQIWDRAGFGNGNDASKQESRQIIISQGDFSSNGVFQYNLTTPLTFRSYSMFGVYQPSQSSVRFYYHTGSTHTSPYFYEHMSNPSVVSGLHKKIINTDGIILIHPITDPPDSASGFLDTVNLNEAVQAENINGVTVRNKQQRVFPNISFTCDGSITKWIVGGGTGGSSSPLSEIQIWRRSGVDSYTKVASTQLTAQSATSDTNVYTYVPSSPLGFQKGDILGVYQREDSSVVPYYQESTGPQNLRQSGLVNSAATSITAPSLATEYDYPLVTVEIGPPLSSVALSTTSFTTEGHPLSSVALPTPFTTEGSPLSSVALPAPFTTEGPPLSSVALLTPFTTEHSPLSSMALPTPFTTQGPPLSSVGLPTHFTTEAAVMLASVDTTVIEPPHITAAHTITQVSSIFNFLSAANTRDTLVPIASFQPSSSMRETQVYRAQPSASMKDNQFYTLAQLSSSITEILDARTLSNIDSATVTETPFSINTPNITQVVPAQLSTNIPAVVAATVLVVVLLVAAFAAGSVVAVLLMMMRKARTRSSQNYNDTTKQLNINNPNYSDERNVQPLLELYTEVSAGNYEASPNVLTTECIANQRPAAHPQSTYVWSTIVPTMSQRKTFSNSQNRSLTKEDIYSKIAQDNYQLYQTTAYHYFEELQAYWEPGSDRESIYEQLAIRKYREINRQHIKINAHLGSGQFGYVDKGVWLSPEGPVDVAVKTLKVEASEEQRVKFLQEAAINGQFHHPNIVKLHGVVTVGEPAMIVLELVKNGDLRGYLHTLRPIPGEMAPPSLPQQLLGYCRQIASGMEYLSKKSFVHRDLAARNILVDDKRMCKIADFGMSRDLSDSDYYVSQGGKIPIKWTAPEAVQYKKYSTASDVWSFAVLMYEIWSLGHKPFEDEANSEVVRLIDTGYRLPPPPGCPRVVYQLMIDCWHPEASGRLSFGIVVSRLSQPENQLLKWTLRDKSVTHPQSTMLGAPLQTASDLHSDLQQQYM